MKIKYPLLLTFVVFLSLTAIGQFKQLGKSPSFEEPETGYAKILNLKNGNTAYLHVTIKEGILLKIYDKDFKQILTKKLNHKFGALKGLNVEGCLETKGNITLIISEYENKTPTLYAIVLDTKEGKILSQETIATLKKLTLGQGYAAAFGGVPLPDFIVRRDPYSENYVVAAFNSFESERDKRVELVHYNSSNEIISKSYLSTPDDKYKYVNILDIAVMEDKAAYALLYAYNTRSSGGKEEELLLAKFNKNDNNVSYQTLELENDLKVYDGIIKYNPVTKKLHILTQIMVDVKSKGGFFSKLKVNSIYSISHYLCDVSNNKISKGSELNNEALENKYTEIFGPKSSYSSVLQNFYINDDGGYTIILEGYKEEITTRQSGNSVRTSTRYFWGDVSVLNYNLKGALTSSTLMPKLQELNTNILSGGGGAFSIGPLYHYKRDFTAQQLKGGNQYKSFAYLNGKKNNYILMNDIEENQERIAKGKLTTIQGVGDCDGFSFIANSTNILPDRKYVFNKPDGKRDHNLGIFTISDYERNSNIYATLKLQVDGRDKKVCVVWLQPE